MTALSMEFSEPLRSVVLSIVTENFHYKKTLFLSGPKSVDKRPQNSPSGASFANSLTITAMKYKTF